MSKIHEKSNTKSDGEPVNNDPLALILIVIAILLVLGMLFYPLQSKAHDWYPMECCHQFDCGVATYAGFIHSSPSELPNLVISTRHGTVVVPHDFKYRDSKDGQVHACMRRMGSGEMVLICIFAPPSM